uniref:Uncharacterized protein n=1 Tax=Candidatus Kentrum sp. SD TaxID=2126332 RepID=A0A451BID8_9GAMM|nr:MAG: hypothetical protein BECKSD772D_GA0070982_100532 [Candidatus Kentron sp. SD]
MTILPVPKRQAFAGSQAPVWEPPFWKAPASNASAFHAHVPTRKQALSKSCAPKLELGSERKRADLRGFTIRLGYTMCYALLNRLSWYLG